MKQFRIYWLMLTVLGFIACAEDEEIGDIPSLTPEYALPQGNSPADDRIVALYNKYGTYVLYDYLVTDLKWMQTDVNNTWNDYTYTSPEPRYAGNMLDLLDKIWFRFYPEEFHKKFMPYKIFLTSTLSYKDREGVVRNYNSRVVRTQMVISNCSEFLTTMSNETKLMLKRDVQSQLWGSWLGKFNIPKAFYKVSNYNGLASSDPTNWNYARERGFVIDHDGKEWSTTGYNPTLSENADLDSFLSGMRNRTSEQWAEDLKYPLVKEKYDILRNYFLDNFDFDIQAIGDATVL